MNRNDQLALRELLAEYVSEQRIRYDDAGDDTRDGKRRQAQIGKKIDAAVKLYKKLAPAPYKPPKQDSVKVGECPCGEPILIGDRYSTRVGQTAMPTTLSRTCRRCGRQNDVELTVLYAVRPLNWHVRDCICGKPIRLRSDYAGYGFSGYEGLHDFRGITRKNRTTTVKCRCGCIWSFAIRFTTHKTGELAGKTERAIPDIRVTRCDRCAKVEVPGMTPVEPKRKRA
jgi:RNase P subunit RPR2